MDVEHLKNIFDTLYSDVNGYSISHHARQKMTFYDQAHTYGEITFPEFSDILKQIKPKSGEVFYDLGSGTGKAVIAAHLLFPFSKCVGIETIESLVKAAESVYYRYKSEYGDVDEKKNSVVQFIHGDFLKESLDDANVIFAHSTCFYPELMKQLEDKLTKLKPGTRVITVSKTIERPEFQLLKYSEYNFSWGKTTVYFYER